MATETMTTSALSHDEIERLLQSLSLTATAEDGIPDMDDFARVVGWAWRARMDHRKQDSAVLEAVLSGEFEVRIGPPHPGFGFRLSDPTLHFWVRDGGIGYIHQVA
jgi:hypothetical protein